MKDVDFPIHERTKQLLEQSAQDPHHAYIFLGNSGLGTFEAAKAWIASIHPEQRRSILDEAWEHLYVIDILKSRKSIGIEQIKTLESAIALTSKHKRYVIVRNAHTLTREAQNAFLKTLEEVRGGTTIILLSDELDPILPTVRSRSHIVTFQPITQDEFHTWIKTKASDDRAKQLFYLSNGQPQFASMLLSDEKLLETKLATLETAKDLLGNSLVNKIKKVSQLSKQKEESLEVLYTLKLICAAAMRNSAADMKKASVWSRKAEHILDAIDNLQKNANSRLTLLQLVVHL